MPKLDMPVTDALFQQWTSNFANVALANAADLGLTPAQTARIQAAANAFKDTYQASQDAKTILRARVGAKLSAREEAEEVFRSYGAMILSNPEVSPGLKGSLGMKANRTQGPPLTPVTDLSAAGYSNGGNVLRWNRNGNTDRTIFLIEAQYEGSLEWRFVGTTSRVRFVHADQVPGVPIVYRVTSRRGETQSLPSNLAPVYESRAAIELKPAA